MPTSRIPVFLLLVALAALASGCARVQRMSSQECLARAMYFESNRSSEEGMLAVGTVVMNRLQSGKYPESVCGVVGQKNQFAPGVLSKPMAKGRDLAMRTAGRVLKGERHPRVAKAMFFHTAGYSYPYTNMHYVTIQGGNAFYEKRRNATSTQAAVAAREAAEREGRLPYQPAARQVAVVSAPAAPATAQGVALRRAARQIAAEGPPPRATGQTLDTMSIEDLIRMNGG
ncbi:cell wall hydrolase [Aureimonas jatrophae]|jgi:spore germination cell wall hydrolase CwlJ-like protein|uniref:Cell Wall Hydrolase n=1 Tax=Aureimonas jatrophae TaxID=1166073 RepID=A0A1H0KL42_9HYPH|nr:cell wall hydrolase [Aureimonas jatrophae]MBB3948757.1 spore germination cell wall hydrolase CwlJ-like protein [Aureimonas jatrophae]SDO56543.1 Cell Wall Hydrolase [Aureimonas jatrophae]